MNLEALVLPLEMSDKGFRAGIAAATAGVAALVAGMGLAVKATFQWADEMDSLQDIMGGTNATAAALNFTLRKSGVATETLTKGMTILSKGLIKADGSLDTIGKGLKNWGINVMDANGMLKDQTTLIGDISDKYATFSTQQEKVNFLTEVFGRSGADLIDFFDTLAADGGIDAVAEKIEKLGLAIDPNRYEQFNRNLEEMKLIGLGLAVGFTERIMPALEAMSEWVFTKGIPGISKFGSKINDAFKEGGVLGAADFILDEFDNIDWDKVSSAVISGINSIDWAQAGMDFSALTKRVTESIAEFFGEVDWLGLGNSLASGLNNFIAGMFGTDEAGMQEIIQTKLSEIDTTFAAWATGAPSSLDALDAGINEKVTTAMTNLWTTITTKLQSIGLTIRSKTMEWAVTVGTTLGGMVSSAMQSLGAFATSIDSKLRDIAKVFFNRALAWGQQMIIALNTAKAAVIGVISGMVGEINGLLKKIITSFHLTVTYSDPVPGTGGASGSSNLGSNSPRPNQNNAPRASGGPVMGGYSYMVGEKGPELFTPGDSGRITPNNQLGGQTVVATIDEARLARTIVAALMQAGYGG